MLKFLNGVLVELTPDEELAIKQALHEEEKKELIRPLNKEEVLDVIVKSLINFIDIPDSTSVRMKSYYPNFEDIAAKKSPEEKTVEAGFKLMYNGDLWKVRQKHMVQSIYPPSIDTAALYERINETNSGTKTDPVPYDQTMEVYNGVYYLHNNNVYLCIRDSFQPLYTVPGALLDNYFKFSHSLETEV